MNTWLVLHECCGPHFSNLHSGTPAGGVKLLQRPAGGTTHSGGGMTSSGGGNGEGKKVQRQKQWVIHKPSTCMQMPV